MDVNLGASMKGSLLVLQATQASRAEAEAALATGLKVRSPVENAGAFFGASALRSRAEALQATVSDIGLAKSTLEASLNGIESGKKLLTQLRAQVSRFEQYLPGETDYAPATLELRGGLSVDTDVGTLDDDPYTPGPLANGRNFQIRVENRQGQLIDRARFRYDAAGPIGADNLAPAMQRFNFRTVGQLVEDINASDLGLRASLEGGQLRIASDDPDLAIRVAGSRDIMEALHMRRDRIWSDQTNPSETASTIIRGVGGVTEATDIGSLPGGAGNNQFIRFVIPSEESARGYTEATFRYRLDGRGDLGGRTVGDFIRFIENTVPELDARIENGQLLVEGDGRGIYVHANTQMHTALGMARGTYWGGATEAPKRLVGAVAGLSASTDAAGSMNFIQDGQGGQVRFRYGTAANRDGTTLGDLVNTINAAEARGEVKLKAGFTDEGRLYIESTGGTDFLPVLPGNRPIRVAGLTYNRVWGDPNTEPYVLPTASNGITEAQWDDFQALGDMVSQYDSLLRDAQFDGADPAIGENRTITINDRGTRAEIGRSLGLLSNRIDLSEIEIWDVIEPGTLQETLDAIDAAIDTVEGEAARLGTQIATLDIRADFNRQLANSLQAGADDLTLADPDEAGARLLAAQARQQMAQAAMTIVAEADRGVLRLFG